MSGPGLRKRLAAVLCADVAGYARLMASDQVATVAALDAARAVFRAKIELNGGRVVDMSGDSVLAAFQTATGAANAALSIQSEMLAVSPCRTISLSGSRILTWIVSPGFRRSWVSMKSWNFAARIVNVNVSTSVRAWMSNSRNSCRRNSSRLTSRWMPNQGVPAGTLIWSDDVPSDAHVLVRSIVIPGWHFQAATSAGSSNEWPNSFSTTTASKAGAASV